MIQIEVVEGENNRKIFEKWKIWDFWKNRNFRFSMISLLTSFFLNNTGRNSIRWKIMENLWKMKNLRFLKKNGNFRFSMETYAKEKNASHPILLQLLQINFLKYKII